MDINLIEKYFPELTEHQKQQFMELYPIYEEWNAKINVVSRKDFDQLYLRHVLHSLAIAKVCQFEAGATILDVGCGGGFPSIPLAILLPECYFIAVDSIAKKIAVVSGVSSAVGLHNVSPRNCRAEQIKEQFDYVISRAVTDMSTFVGWVWPKIKRGKKGSMPNGILYLKGGDLTQELAETDKKWVRYPISNYFEEEFFETKQVVYTEK